MLLYIGADTVIDDDNIIGIFDMDKTTVSGKTRDFLNYAEHHKKIISAAYDIPKSFILCKNGDIYLAQPNPSTLENRSKLNIIN